MSARKQIWLGFGIGVLTVFLISLAAFLRSNPGFTVSDYFSIFVNGKVLAPLLSVALIGNLAVFFFFININKDYISRGILIATMMIGVLILILKFAA